MKRYILTEDNKIIDTNDLKELELEYVSSPLENDYLEGKFNSTTCECFTIGIKVASNNIFDLVEIDDLVEIAGFGSAPSIKREVVGGVWGKHVDAAVHMNDILAIWKPNVNKGYDLVWEKEK